MHAWLFVMKSEAERSWSANRGYDDSAGIYYSYDSNVGHSRQVGEGDLVVVRHDDYIAGWGVHRVDRGRPQRDEGDPALSFMPTDEVVPAREHQSESEVQRVQH
jgi:hypothetical protein